MVKRQREQAKRERQQKKAEKRAERKNKVEGSDESSNDLDVIESGAVVE
jgi:hypothetical protein